VLPISHVTAYPSTHKVDILADRSRPSHEPTPSRDHLSHIAISTEASKSFKTSSLVNNSLPEGRIAPTRTYLDIT